MSLLEELKNSVIEGEPTKSAEIADQIVKNKGNIQEAIIKGLNAAMLEVSRLYKSKEYYLPEIIIASDALYSALEVFKPHLEKVTLKKKAVVVIGVVRGDIHDIGKNLTKLFLEAMGYEVIDCGRNVKAETFIEKIREHDADILALSTLMNPTLESISELIEILKKEGIYSKLTILIGGAATNEEFSKKIGVTYCREAFEAIEVLDRKYGGK
ncbi:MAG: Dimethylamine corrinoid protein [Promethearchaeota archaeon]|nr:MAG: Dimethylamine corrinoid protein [Candidatus Lokiarchaeota archaeon]